MAGNNLEKNNTLTYEDILSIRKLIKEEMIMNKSGSPWDSNDELILESRVQSIILAGISKTDVESHKPIKKK